MSFEEKLDHLNFELGKAKNSRVAQLERFEAEINFAKCFAETASAKKNEWQELILKAVKHVNDAMAAPGAFDPEKAISEAEIILAPIGKVAKEYTIHCCGHAHIDMNWQWPWQETVSVTHDTFYTMDKLMDEYPEFRFSQSQASTYMAMEKYCPEIFEMIKKRVKEGRWEVTASNWVEGDKNIVSGESLCRHLLYTRKYFKDKFGMQPEDVKIDWSPDTFGHAYTVPSILVNGGVNRYYFHRTGPNYWLFKWKSPDGSEIYAYKDKDKYAYNGHIDPLDMGTVISDYVKETGLKDFMYMYGVGDHGGGPTRRDLNKARDCNTWPIFPNVKLSTTDAYFDAVEKAKPKLPVFDGDMNFIFEGCYTSQSNIKRATRISETVLPEAETMALIAGAVDKMEYPTELLIEGWRHTLFNHFHDILPGSGVKATYEYSQGLFQEIQSIASTIRTRSLRMLSNKVNTAKVANLKSGTLDMGVNDRFPAGAGSPMIPGGVSGASMGATSAQPILVYNQKPWARSNMVYTEIWDRDLIDDKVVVRDSDGKEYKGQVVGRGNYWAHTHTMVAFKADVPALGYKVFAVDNSSIPVPVQGEGASLSGMMTGIYSHALPDFCGDKVMENEYLKVVMDFPSGAIKHLIDKETGFDYVPEGQLFGLIEAYQEDPHGMSSWCIGQTPEVTQLKQGGKLHVLHGGPNRVAIRTDHQYRDSRISIEIGLNSGSRMVDFNVRLHWVERGTPETGVPMLKVAFPLRADKEGVSTYEIPFGAQVRPQSPQEIPALKWADISGETGKDTYGITMVNDSKYGHSCVKNNLRLTLIRSSYDPDPLPEIANHEIKFAVVPHKGACDIVEATKLGEEFNSPMAVVSAPVCEGSLPAEHSFVEVLTPNIFVSTIKMAEDESGIVVRMFETIGKKTTAKVKIDGLVKKGAKAIETDTIERPLDKSSAKFEDNILSVVVPAFGHTTVKIGNK